MNQEDNQATDICRNQMEKIFQERRRIPLCVLINRNEDGERVDHCIQQYGGYG